MIPSPIPNLPSGSLLTSNRRAKAIARLAEQKQDIIVIGGGVTGAGVALDAASRGLRTVLVERTDLAAGTSRWSSKLVHGGLRYLTKLDMGVAWESARERGRLMAHIAPHLVHEAAVVIPLDRNTGAAMGALAETGIRVGDVMRQAALTSHRLLPPPRRIPVPEMLRLAPGLDVSELRGGIVYWDGQLEDDARLVTAIARTAAAYGAEILTHCAASEVHADRVTVTDRLTGQSLVARGTVINATGVWAGEHEPSIRIVPSRGSHIVVRGESLGLPRAIVTAPVPGHFGRYVFAMPQPDGLVYIGLTDEQADSIEGEQPTVPESDEKFLLSTINGVLARPLVSSDVVGRFAGLRPLVQPADTKADGLSHTADISRKHLLVDEPGRPITVTGGKLTTYRQMAEEAVNAAVLRLGGGQPCRTARLPLVGAADRHYMTQVHAPTRLIRKYGVEAPAVAALAEADQELTKPVAPGSPVTGVELLFGVVAEGALTVDDLLSRRTRLSMVEADAAAARPAAERVLELAGVTDPAIGSLL